MCLRKSPKVYKVSLIDLREIHRKVAPSPPTISSEAGSLLSTVTPGMTVTMPRRQPAANNPASSSTHDLSQPPSGTSHG